MKRILTLLFCLALFTIPAFASEGTAYTYTVSIHNDWTRTQDAYLPGATFLRGQQLGEPSDICVSGDLLYVADTDNGRVLAYQMQTGAVREVGKGLFHGPTGVFVGSDGKLYVADENAAKVFVLDAEGRVLLRIGRPHSALFGSASPFKPRKVAADVYGNIYVVGEGSYQGMMLFSKTGEFIGYYGSNQTSITVLQKLEDTFFTEQQREQLFNRIPKTICNAALGTDGLIYTVTQDDPSNSVKALNMAGQNVLSEQGNVTDETDFVDIAVSPSGQIYALTQTGYIYEYDPDGDLVFSFGGQSITTERSGLFTVAAAIDVDSRGVVYVLDKERGLVQAFYPTDYAAATHAAIQSLSTGNYQHSSNQWQALIRQNGIARIAHSGYGHAQLLMRNYAAAEQQFYLIRDKADYSQAFWQLRSRWFSDHFRFLMIALLSVIFVWVLLAMLDRRLHLFRPARERWRRLRRKPGLLRDLLFVKNMVRHPIDGFYDLKKGKVGSVYAAAILCLTAFALFLIQMLFSGFLFRTADPEDTPLMTLVLAFFVTLGLFVVGNTLVSSVGSGEGNLHRVFVMTAYALSPYILFMPIVIVLTYVLTLNEGFLISMGSFIILSCCAVYIYLGIAQTHNFEGWEVWKNILLTIFFMMMAIVAVSIVYLLWTQIAEFVKMLVKEAIYRARG